MEKLISEIVKVKEISFPHKGYSSLTKMMHDLSRKYGVPFSSDHSDNQRLIFTYTFSFGGVCKNIMKQTVK